MMPSAPWGIRNRGVEGVYDQHHYTAEKASALRALAGLVAEIVQERSGRRVGRVAGLSRKSHGRRSSRKRAAVFLRTFAAP